MLSLTQGLNLTPMPTGVQNPTPLVLYQTRLPLAGAANTEMTVQHVINLESMLSKHPRLLQ